MRKGKKRYFEARLGGTINRNAPPSSFFLFVASTFLFLFCCVFSFLPYLIVTLPRLRLSLHRNSSKFVAELMQQAFSEWGPAVISSHKLPRWRWESWVVLFAFLFLSSSLFRFRSRVRSFLLFWHLVPCFLFFFLLVRLTPAANYKDVGEGSKVYIVVAAFGKLPHPSAARAPMRRWPAFLHRLAFPSFRSVSD